MSLSEAQAKAVDRVLLGLVVLDTVLTSCAFFAPELWFSIFHGVPYAGNDPEGFLRRCGANWAAFLLCQVVAWRSWKAQPGLLALVAGVRLSDIFTDPVYYLMCEHKTWIAAALLPAGGLMNVALGWYLWRAYRRATAARQAS